MSEQVKSLDVEIMVKYVSKRLDQALAAINDYLEAPTEGLTPVGAGSVACSASLRARLGEKGEESSPMRHTHDIVECALFVLGKSNSSGVEALSASSAQLGKALEMIAKYSASWRDLAPRRRTPPWNNFVEKEIKPKLELVKEIIDFYIKHLPRP